MKKICDRQTSDSLLVLVRMGKARLVKEYVDSEPEIFAHSASGTLIGCVGKRYKYLFEAALNAQGSGDGLLDGVHQTTSPIVSGRGGAVK